jgi:hypothetical protein
MPTKVKDDPTKPLAISEQSEGASIGTLYDECAGIVNHTDRRDRVQAWKEEIGFYHNGQWTRDESTDLDALGQVDVVLNTLRRSVRTLLSQTVAASPTAKFVPRDIIPTPGNESESQRVQEDMQTAESLQGLWDNSWYVSGGNVILRRAVQNQIICGLGWLGVYLDPRADYYRGEVKFRTHLPWEKVVPLTSREMDFSDCKRVFTRTLVPLSEALEIVGREDSDVLRRESYAISDGDDYDLSMYGPNKTEVKPLPIRDTISNSDSDQARLVEWIETEERVRKPAYLYKVELANNQMDTVIVEPVADADIDPEEEFQRTVEEMQWQVISKERMDIDVPRIKKTIQAGRSILIGKPTILPISSFSDIPIIDEDTYNPLPYGEVYYVSEVQRLLNKVFSLAVLHLQTSGGGDKLIGLKGAFGDTPEQVEAFMKQYARPTSATELAVENTDGRAIAQYVEKIPATPMPPATIQALSMLTGWIDRLFGINPMAYGDAGAAPRTLGATISIKEWSDENARIPLMHLNYALQRVGDVWLEMALRHYRFHKTVTVPDYTGKMRAYEYNRMDRNGNIINRLDKIRANIFITSGTSLMVNRYAMLMVFKELMPIHPIFTKLFLMYSDIPDKFDIMQEIDHTAQLEQQLAQLAPQLEQLQKLASAKDEELQSALQKVDLVKTRAALNNIETKYREWTKGQRTKEELGFQAAINALKQEGNGNAKSER